MKGRGVLITGGSRGIGAACVRRFCALGDRVVFFYRNSEENAKALERECGAKAIRVDVTDGNAVFGAIAEAERILGSVDVLVNNAGISQIGLFCDGNEAETERMIRTDLISAMRISREIAKGMIRAQSGKIVNVGSMWGKTGASCEVVYSAAKAGIRGFTMALAKELGPSHINVNCVEPGVIDTDMNAHLSEETRRELCDQTPLCRIGCPDDVANAIAFLASDAASFITGQILGVDGGFAI